MLPVRHKWPQLEMGGSMHTNATKGLTSRCGTTPYTERHKGLTLFSGDHRHEGLGQGSTKGNPLRQETGLYKILGAHFHNWIGGSQAVTTQITSYQWSKQELGFPKETLAKGPSSEWGGNAKCFSEIVDRGLLRRFSKDQRLWWVKGGDLVDLVNQFWGCLWMNSEMNWQP